MCGGRALVSADGSSPTGAHWPGRLPISSLLKRLNSAQSGGRLALLSRIQRARPPVPSGAGGAYLCLCCGPGRGAEGGVQGSAHCQRVRPPLCPTHAGCRRGRDGVRAETGLQTLWLLRAGAGKSQKVFVRQRPGHGRLRLLLPPPAQRRRELGRTELRRRCAPGEAPCLRLRLRQQLPRWHRITHALVWASHGASGLECMTSQTRQK